MLGLTSAHKTWMHRLPVGPKLALLALFSVVLFWLDNLWPMLVALVLVAALVASGGAGFARQALRLLQPVWFFVALLAVWHLWLNDPLNGLRIALRLVVAVTAANLVTLTSRLSDMIDLIERLLGRKVALTLGLALRFVPVLGERAAMLSLAWRARSQKRAAWRLVPGLTVGAFDEADHMAEALRARGGLV
ncbi:energy-coupling factor transporter transmembrane component T family protein [Neogemmobacter tilapiae]|uniref:ABC transporter permease n=1 Tax=Neogemmobacter tilapiae TaxID=875041 RepID=A0A918TK81_9RHOB|nr:energy-coupling factor transporter transmembrane protein EcfT [Gemmobacter tilapiae]GHC49436.1 ABC transporter permease [Gemmobacter tilapiae]